jgi:hypothetical protein
MKNCPEYAYRTVGGNQGENGIDEIGSENLYLRNDKKISS